MLPCADTTHPIFCKSPTVAALLGLEFVKSIKPDFSALAGRATGVCSAALSAGLPFVKSAALYHLPSLPFSRTSPSAFLGANGLATGVAFSFGLPFGST